MPLGDRLLQPLLLRTVAHPQLHNLLQSILSTPLKSSPKATKIGFKLLNLNGLERKLNKNNNKKLL